MIRRKRPAGRDGLEKLVSETQELVAKLVLENKALRTRNQRLTKELERVSKGWDEIKKIARSAPRARPQSRGR